MAISRQQTREYRLRRGWFAFLLGLGLVPAVAGGMGCVYFGTGNEVNSERDVLIMVGICGAFVLLGLSLVGLAMRVRLIVSLDQIVYREVFRTKCIEKARILGWRTTNATTPPIMTFILKGDEAEKLQIVDIFATDSSFHEWLNSIPNLDFEDQVDSLEEVLENDEVGAPDDERLEQLERAKRLARIVNWSAVGLGLWAIFYPDPYDPLMCALVFVPWALLGVVKRSRGTIRIDEHPNDIHPSIGRGMICCSGALLLRAVVDFDVASIWVWILWGCILSIAHSAAAVMADPALKPKRASLIAFVLINFTYGFGASLYVNVLADGSDPVVQRVQVVSKNISTYRGTHHRLQLEPWGPVDSDSTVEVSKQLYEEVAPGGSVCVALHRGSIGIMWFTTHPCE